MLGAVLVAVRLGLVERPAGTSWALVYGVALLCGVGFTMSLFIGLRAFAGTPELEAETRIGVLAGSMVSMVAGALVVLLSPQAAKQSSA